MILGADNRKKYSHLDVMILQAYQILEDERCPQHGGPRWMCDHPDGKLNFKINDIYCRVASELKDEEDKRQKNEDKGIILRPEFYDRDDRPLESFRATYYEHKAREAAEEAEEAQD